MDAILALQKLGDFFFAFCWTLPSPHQNGILGLCSVGAAPQSRFWEWDQPWLLHHLDWIYKINQFLNISWITSGQNKPSLIKIKT